MGCFLYGVYKLKLNYQTDDIQDYILDVFCNDRLKDGQQTISKTIDMNCDPTALLNWLIEHGFIICQSSEKSFVGLKGLAVAFRIVKRNLAYNVCFIGDVDDVNALIKKIGDDLPSNKCFVRWIYDPTYLEEVITPVNDKNLPIQEMYPFLGESIQSYYNRFVESNANILVMIGPPGTGKTTFLRGLLTHTKKSATLTYHEKILSQDSFFVSWIQNEDTFMIIEDADNHLMPRTDGNDMMARFLNMGDGLSGFSNKKMIFTTNLPNINDIDSALTRPGRCFDILEFRHLDRKEASELAKKIDVNLPDGDKFTVSEIFATKLQEVNIKQKKSTFGFI